MNQQNSSLRVRFRAWQQYRQFSHSIHKTPRPELKRSFSLPKDFLLSPVQQFPILSQKVRRKSCHCKECGNMTNFQYRNMNIPLILKPSRFGRQQSIRCNRLLTVKNTKKLFRKYSATRQDTLVSPSSSQLILTTLRRASARSTDRLIEDTHVRIVEPPKSCRSHLIANPLKDEIKNITLTIPKSQRIIKTLPSETQKIKLLPSIQSMTRIYTRNFLSCYLNKYKKSKTHMSLQKIC